MVRLVHGVGINDADYATQPRANGIAIRCPFYVTWTNMLKRCYSQASLAARSTYAGCTVADEWHSFMVFKRWMEKQDWRGNCLDKDILIPDNKVYSPNTCVFVSNELNNFLTTKPDNGQNYPMGVMIEKKSGLYTALIRLGKGKRKYLGRFETPELAHKAWQVAKYEQALQVASTQKDERVAKAIVDRFRMSL